MDPFIGTDPSGPGYIMNNCNGNVFPGAVAPQGMVQFSPDTPDGNAGGYLHSEKSIKGFSLTHFSGRGIDCWMDFPILPVLGPSPGSKRRPQGFSHQEEGASPGYYQVKLASGILVELSATARTGFARFTFPAGSQPVLQVDSQGNATSEAGGTLQFPTGDTVSGETTGHGCGGAGITYKVFFYAKFDRPFSRKEIWSKARGANFFFDRPENGVVRMKVGISFVDAEGAKSNLESESPNWDFDALRQRTASAWRDRLSKIQVVGGTADDKKVFYTAFYHASLHPNLFSDADGRFLGFDGKVHSSPDGRPRYENFASWDSYRTLMPFLSVMFPRETSDMMRSLVGMAREDLSVRPQGGGLPKWQQANTDSGGMEGDCTTLIVASAWALGARDFDARKALEAMERGASVPGTTSGGRPVRPHLAEWLKTGYVERRGSLCLEYANADFALSQFALALGEKEKAATYLARSGAWKDLFDPGRKGGHFVPKPWGGGLTLAYPLLCGLICGFEEGNSGQYTWLLPYSYPELFEMLGGPEKVLGRLDGHFYDGKGRPRVNEGPQSPYAFLGNEPGSAAPYAYLFAGAPERTSKLLREAVPLLFTTEPKGLPGNDDGGAMSSWLIWAMMGIRPLVSGTERVFLTGPMFDAVTLRLEDGKTLSIRSRKASPSRTVLDHVTFNGKKVSGVELPWSRLSKGGNLEFHYR